MKRRTTVIVRPSNLGPGRLLRLLRSRAVSSRPAKNMMAYVAKCSNGFGSSDSAPRGIPGRKVSSRWLLAWLIAPRKHDWSDLHGRDDRRQYSVQAPGLGATARRSRIHEGMDRGAVGPVTPGTRTTANEPATPDRLLDATPHRSEHQRPHITDTRPERNQPSTHPRSPSAPNPVDSPGSFRDSHPAAPASPEI